MSNACWRIQKKCAPRLTSPGFKVLQNPRRRYNFRSRAVRLGFGCIDACSVACGRHIAHFKLDPLHLGRDWSPLLQYTGGSLQWVISNRSKAFVLVTHFCIQGEIHLSLFCWRNFVFFGSILCFDKTKMLPNLLLMHFFEWFCVGKNTLRAARLHVHMCELWSLWDFEPAFGI